MSSPLAIGAVSAVLRNLLDNGFMASPAVADGALFLRTKTDLYRIQQAAK